MDRGRMDGVLGLEGLQVDSRALAEDRLAGNLGPEMPQAAQAVEQLWVLLLVGFHALVESRKGKGRKGLLGPEGLQAVVVVEAL